MDDDWSDRSWTRFRALCYRLRLNDPNATRLDAMAGDDDFDYEFPNDNGSDSEFPQGYGSHLGQALMNGPNTHVTAIKLMLTSLLNAGRPVQELSPLLFYLLTGTALRRLHLKDQGDAEDFGFMDGMEDMHDIVPELCDYPRVPIVAALLEAAGANDHLEELKMFMDIAKHHVPAFCKLLRSKSWTLSLMCLTVQWPKTPSCKLLVPTKR